MLVHSYMKSHCQSVLNSLIIYLHKPLCYVTEMNKVR